MHMPMHTSIYGIKRQDTGMIPRGRIYLSKDRIRIHPAESHVVSRNVASSNSTAQYGTIWIRVSRTLVGNKGPSLTNVREYRGEKVIQIREEN